MRKPLADKIQSERRVLQALRGNRVLTDPLASFDERRLALGALDDKLCLFAETAVTKSRERLHALAGRLESLGQPAFGTLARLRGRVLGRRPGHQQRFARAGRTL